MRTNLRYSVSPSGIAGSVVPAFWTRDAEASASSDASASSYCAAENVRVLAIVEAESELVRVKRQIFLAHLMVTTHDATLEQAPEPSNRVRVNHTANIFTGAVLDDFVRQWFRSRTKQAIARVLVRRNQFYLVPVHGTAHELVESQRVRVLNHAADHVAFTGDYANDGTLSRRAVSDWRLEFSAVLIRGLAADIGFVGFNNAHKLAELRVCQSRTEPMTHEPRRPIGTRTDHPMNLKGANPFLTGQHQVQNLEPDQQLVIRVLEDGPDRHGEAVGLARLVTAHATSPMKGLELQGVDLGVVATRTLNAIRPTLMRQVFLTCIFVREEPIKLGKSHLPDKLRFACFYFLVHALKDNAWQAVCQVQHNRHRAWLPRSKQEYYRPGPWR